jgi:cytochrome c biogenesis protein CcmG/thiol:disulfide interchange protein DsbE
MNTRYVLPLGLFAALVFVLAIGLKLDPRRVPSPLIDKPAPQFELPQLDDPAQTFRLADLRGKPVILNVWASWCRACIEEHPILLAMVRNHAISIYGLNYKDTRDDALAWLSRHGNPYSNSAFDEKGRVGIEYGVYGVPETFVIDADGIIRYKHIGPVSQQTIDKVILPLVQR